MALIPFLLDCDISQRPRRRYRSSIFDLDDFLERPLLRSREISRPWRNLAAAVRDADSTIKSDKDKFQINLDVQHFAPEEITVKTANGHVIIEGNHEEKEDEHGFVARQFTRRYALPEGCNPESVVSKLSSDGVLTVTAPKLGSKDERMVPITHTGPVRRKAVEEENGEASSEEKEEKSPQKKRRR